MHRLAQFLARYPRAAAAAVALFSLWAVVGLTRLQFDNDPRNLFKVRDADYAEMERLAATFGADDGACVVVLQADDVFSPNVLEVARQLVAQAQAIPGVASVQSVFDARRPGPGRVQLPLVPKPDASSAAFAAARRRALRHPLLAGQLLSADGRTMLVLVQLAGARPEFTQIGRVTEQLRTLLVQLSGDGVRLRLTGVPAIRAEIERLVQRDLLRFNLLGAVLSNGFGWLLLRRPAAVLVVTAPPVLGSLWITGSMGWLGVPINVINGVVPTLVLVIGMTDSVHFLIDIQHSRAQGRSAAEAAAMAVAHVGTASGLTSLTTAVGFSSLAVARVEMIRDFGLVCAAASVLTFLAVVIVVPLLAASPLGEGLFRLQAPSTQRRGRWAGAVVAWSIRRHRPLAAASVLATVALTAVALRMSPDNWIAENLPRGAESGEALAHCDAAFGGLGFIHAVVEWPDGMAVDDSPVLGALTEVHRVLANQPPLRNTLSLLNLLATLPEASRSLNAAVQYLPRVPDELRRRSIDPTGRQLLVSAHVPDCGAARLAPRLAELQDKLRALEVRHPGFRFQVTSSQVMATRNVPKLIGDLGNSIGLEAAIIFGLMTWAFRSWALGLVSILPNVFPLVCVAALIVVLGWPLQIGSVIVFNICLGLAVDDTIHVMTRFRRELRTCDDVRLALQRSFAAVGPAMLNTSAFLLAGFVTVMLSRVPALRLFGGLASVTILTALVAELVLLPALLTAALSRRGK